jgi:glycosyltransferase involved in cell wall biosynthesis
MINMAQVMPDDYFPSICGNAFVADNFGQLIQRFGESVIFIENKDNRDFFRRINGNLVFNLVGKSDRITKEASQIMEKEDIKVLFFHDFSHKKFSDLMKNDFGNNFKKIALMHYFDPKVIEYTNFFDAIIVFQEDHLKLYKEISDKDKFFYIPHVVSSTFFLRNLSPEKDTVIYAGRVIKEKGPHLLLPYMKELGIKKYTIVGNIPDENYREFLESEIERLSISDSVCWIQKSVDKKTLSDMFNTHETFFLGSSSDCYSLVLQEALACGMKAIVKDIDLAYNWAADKIDKFIIEEEIPIVFRNSKKSLKKRACDSFDIVSRNSLDTAFIYFESVVEKVLFDKSVEDINLYW